MGARNSRVEMDYGQEPGFTAILQYLIRSGQVHIISEDQDDSDDYNSRTTRTPTRPNTSKLDRSEISLATRQACGIGYDTTKRNNFIPSILHRRELGVNLSVGQRCKISSNYLPNRMQQVAKYDNKAFCGSYSANGNLFLTACQDRFLRLYRTHNGEFTQLKLIPARDVGWSILDTAFSPDGRHIVYSSWSDNLYMCPIHDDSDNQETLYLSPLERRFCIFSLVFSSDGREILGGGNDGFIYVYDRECQQRVLRIEGHEDDVNSVAFADNTSQILYSAGDDGLCKVWDRRMLSENNPQPVGILAGHMDGITFIDPRRDGRHLLTNSKDQTIKLWDVRAFSDHNAEKNTRKAVANQNWDYRWQRVPKKLHRSKHMLEGDTSIMTYRGHSVLQTLIRCHFSPAAATGQRYIYTGCSTGRVVIYDVLTGDIVKSLNGHRGTVRDVSWHPSYQEIISTSWDGVIGRWRYASKVVPLDSRDSEEDSDVETSQPRTLRRSQRIAAQKAKNSSSC